jgi:putative tryptophan/tyrosine transport system substrate-binding protein
MRRGLATGLMVAVLAGALPAGAQPVGRPARVGLLCFARCEGPGFDALRDGLRELGWVEPHTLVIETRAAGGQFDRLPALARELVDLKPDVLVAGSPQPVRAVKDAAGAIPFVFVAVADPVRMGLVQSLARPGGTVTGVATIVPGGFIAKQVELLKELVPGASRLAALMNPTNEIHRLGFPTEVPPAAQALGLQLQVLPVSHVREIEPAIEAAARERADILLVVGDPLFHTPPDRIPALAARARLPAIYISREVARAGGLVSYGPDIPALSRRAASFVDRILKGAKPADLPVEQPTQFELVVNVKAARALGLTVPQTVLLRATEVVQ